MVLGGDLEPPRLGSRPRGTGRRPAGRAGDPDGSSSRPTSRSAHTSVHSFSCRFIGITLRVRSTTTWSRRRTAARRPAPPGRTSAPRASTARTGSRPARTRRTRRQLGSPVPERGGTRPHRVVEHGDRPGHLTGEVLGGEPGSPLATRFCTRQASARARSTSSSLRTAAASSASARSRTCCGPAPPRTAPRSRQPRSWTCTSGQPRSAACRLQRSSRTAVGPAPAGPARAPGRGAEAAHASYRSSGRSSGRSSAGASARRRDCTDIAPRLPGRSGHRDGAPMAPGCEPSGPGRSCQVDDHRRVVAGALALALLAVDQAPVTRAASAGEPRTKSIRMPSRRGEAQLGVVPVGVDARPGACGRTTSAKPASTTAGERRPLGRRHVRRGRERGMSQTSSSCGAMFQSPTSAICACGSAGEPAGAGVAQPGQPLELVVQVRVVERAAVGHVEAPRPGRRRRWRRAPAPRRRAGRPSRASPGSRPRRRPARPGTAIATPFHCECADVRDLVAERPRTARAGTARPCTWSPAARRRRRRCAPARRRPGRPGPGWS